MGALKIAAPTDLEVDGSFGENWIVAGTKGLAVISPATKSHEYFPNEKLTELKVESMVSTGMLTAKIDDEPMLLVRFSNTKAREFGHFSRVAGKLIEGNRIKAEDLIAEDFSPTCPTCGLQYPDPQRKVCPKCLNRRSLFMRLLSYLPKYRRPIINILALVVGSSILKLTTPLLGGKVLFDDVLKSGGRYYGRLGEIVLLMIGVQLLSVGFDVFFGRLNAKVTAKVFYDLKVDIYTNLQRLSYGFFTKKQTGGLMTRINWDAMQLQFLFLDGVPFFLANIFNIIGIAVIMFVLDWRLSLLVLIIKRKPPASPVRLEKAMPCKA